MKTTEVSKRLRRIRAEKDLSRREMADLCQVPEATIASIEQGVNNPRVSTVLRLAQGLAVSPSRLDPRVADVTDEENGEEMEKGNERKFMEDYRKNLVDVLNSDQDYRLHSTEVILIENFRMVDEEQKIELLERSIEMVKEAAIKMVRDASRGKDG